MSRKEYADFCSGATLLMHDAQYTDKEYGSRKGWGHSKLTSVIPLSISAGVKRLGLFHHDPDRTDDDVDRLVELCQEEIAQAGSNVECFGVREEMEITV